MAINEKSLDPLFSTVALIRYPGRMGHATGFFYEDGSNPYLVTNRHVIRDSESGQLESEIRYYLRENPHGTEVTPRDLFLADQPVLEGIDDEIDIAAIPLDIDLRDYANFAISHQHLLEEGTAPEYRVACGKRALVIGYPIRGTTPYYPVARSAMVATPHGKPFEGKPCFLTDARMYDGMSGSPIVISRSEKSHATNQGIRIASREIDFIGIHSAEQRDFITEENDPDPEPTLDLNIAWYPELLQELIE